ncbi:PepSY-associated TM helix domain-containing protein [Pseudomonas sp. SO81]|uniref:PepSY-associated TM helix domain-containing protein n=1 Tax=Pseudomonas sp. SO81 TaxID=2983246 RepID=UPI0025A3364D|nr:PepSY-associated TM helix domain-containing protein [Pseudomonas sp. SO81]WJN58505.1 iron-regulated membrane protein [Pseudomonas sp. SO81]
MSLRQSMAGLHTWGGLLPSWLLYVIILAGTIACFDKELERWMRPALHQGAESSMSADQVREWMQRHTQGEKLHAFWMHGPSEREPYWRLGWEVDGSKQKHNHAFAPAGGEPLPETVGGDFFFRLHYTLQAGRAGVYIVGLAGMFMLVALVSGVIIHRRIFKDFFTLRPNANGQRAWLDAHNLFGVVGFPFHLVLAYTGVVIFVSSYMPAGLQVAYQNDSEQFFSEVGGAYHREEMHQPAPPPLSLNALVDQAEQHWGGSAAGWISVHHPDDASAVVEISEQRHQSRIGRPLSELTFDAASGELLHEQKAPAGYTTYNWLVGLHMVQFGGTLMRGLYFLLGLAGCALLVGGIKVWVAKREARGGAGIGVVRALNGAVFAGLPLASLALLWGNRLIPAGLAERASAEAWVFAGAWLLVALWAVIGHRQPRRLLSLQLALGALLALGLPLLNGLTTEHGHLLSSLARGDWELAGIDLFLIVSGLLSALCAWRFAQPAAIRAPRARRVLVEEAV